MAMTTDVIVIGAGVIGSSVALEMSKNGYETVVVDRGHSPGYGSSSASSAIIRFDYSTLDGVTLAWESSHCWEAWRDHLMTVIDSPLASYRKTGAVTLEAPILPRKHTNDLYKLVGVSAQEWSADDLRRNVPAMDPGRFWPPKETSDPEFWFEANGEIGGTYVSAGGYIDDPLLATRNLAQAAAGFGTRFVYGSPVRAISTFQDRVSGVVTESGEVILAPIIVNAAGPWSGQVNRLAGVDSDFYTQVRPLRVEVHQVPAPPFYDGDQGTGPVIGDLDLGIYVRSAPGGFMLVGGTEPECDELDWVDDPDSVSFHCTKAVHDRQMIRASRRFPKLGIPNIPKGTVGVYDVSADWVPIYDKTSLPGYYVAIGTSGNQFKNAPVVGQIMATLITAGESGVDHDQEPVAFSCPHTGNRLSISAFSRRRKPNENSTGTVLG